MKKRTLLALALALVMAFMGTGSVAYAKETNNADTGNAREEYEEQLKDLNSQLEAIKKAQEAIKKEIDAAKSDKEKQQKEKERLDGQIYNTQQEITLLGQRIDLVSGEIALKETEIAEKQLEINRNYQLFKQRLRASYVSNDPSMLTVLLSSDSFSDMLMRAEVAKRIAERDTELLNNLKTDRAELEGLRAGLQADKDSLEADQQALSDRKQQLSSQVQQVAQTIQDIAELEKQFQESYEEKSKEAAAMRAEIDAIFAELESMDEFVGGEYLWPVPVKYRTISCEYGWRFNNTDFHTGMDITGSSSGAIYGADVYAANSGEVKFVQTTYTPGKGYGKYVIVDHGGGYSTLYAHLSETLVSVGDYVQRGDVIAKVGSTGWSTGPHLHFEYRVNGKAQNPRTILF